MTRWWTDTIARHVEANGEVIAPWDDDRPEEAIFVRTLGALMDSGDETEVENEGGRRPPQFGKASASMLNDVIASHLRWNGASKIKAITAACVRYGTKEAVWQAVHRMWRSGKVIRVGRGLYRLA